MHLNAVKNMVLGFQLERTARYRSIVPIKSLPLSLNKGQSNIFLQTAVGNNRSATTNWAHELAICDRI